LRVAQPASHDCGGQRARRPDRRDSEIFASSPRTLILFDLKNGVSDTPQFAAPIIEFHLNFNHLV
jgi:hypothetical protein